MPTAGQHYDVVKTRQGVIHHNLFIILPMPYLISLSGLFASLVPSHYLYLLTYLQVVNPLCVTDSPRSPYSSYTNANIMKSVSFIFVLRIGYGLRSYHFSSSAAWSVQTRCSSSALADRDNTCCLSGYVVQLHGSPYWEEQLWLHFP